MAIYVAVDATRTRDDQLLAAVEEQLRREGGEVRGEVRIWSSRGMADASAWRTRESQRRRGWWDGAAVVERRGAGLQPGDWVIEPVTDLNVNPAVAWSREAFVEWVQTGNV